ncbi:hypothetical protein R3P38DRAFT_2828227 [Favolaschia claudopus]|uniref:F-box domain-containing protein n=1 Tax=Favolaschia claudopus TaxID=2862362 RepID=A0AAW0EA63_9AGAR
MHEVISQLLERLKSGGGKLHLHHLIEENVSKISSIDDKVTALREQITSLLEQRVRECATSTALRHLAAPARTLPVELLSEIFLLTLPHPPDPVSLHIRAAYRVSHVCSDWREVAIRTPRLWTGPLIVSALKARTEEKDEANAAELRLWLMRSAALSLPIILTSPCSEIRVDNLNRHSLRALLHVACRWRSLKLVYREPWAMSFITKIETGSLVLLEELHLSTSKEEVTNFNLGNAQCFSTAPKLRKLHLNYPCHIPMPWAQITDLSVNSISTSKVLCDVLTRCPNLVSVETYLPVWTMSALPTGGSDFVVLNHLHTLKLGIYRDSMRFFDHLSAPALEDLRLRLECNAADWEETSLISFLSRCPNFMKLDIDIEWGLRITSDALRAIFRHAPSLSHLRFCSEFHTYDSELLHTLTYSDSDAPPLLPRLRSLTLPNLHFGDVGDLLVNMIRSRWWADAELASLPTRPAVARWSEVIMGERDKYHDPRCSVRQRLLDAMQTLRSSGLQVNIEQSSR